MTAVFSEPETICGVSGERTVDGTAVTHLEHGREGAVLDGVASGVRRVGWRSFLDCL